MARRALDLGLAALGLAALAFPLAVLLLLVWLQDFRSPLYVADRVGRGGKVFKMYKVRSMVAGADKTGVESTGSNDLRITPLGHFIRRWKIDELSQLFNVLIGDMSLVGPRPNTVREVESYSVEERELLGLRPGITDFASIIFSDEGEILSGSDDPDADYARLIRPWKSKLGLVYVRNASLRLNIKLILLTLLAVVNKQTALRGVAVLLEQLRCSKELREVSRRNAPLEQFVTAGTSP